MRLLDRGRTRHPFAALPDRLDALGADLQRGREQLGALDYRVEYRARRTGQAECRAVFLRRGGDDRQRDERGHAQRPASGLRALLPPRAAWGQGDCREWRGRRCGGRRCWWRFSATHFAIPAAGWLVVLANRGPQKRVQLLLGANALQAEISKPIRFIRSSGSNSAGRPSRQCLPLTVQVPPPKLREPAPVPGDNEIWRLSRPCSGATNQGDDKSAPVAGRNDDH